MLKCHCLFYVLMQRKGDFICVILLLTVQCFGGNRTFFCCICEWIFYCNINNFKYKNMHHVHASIGRHSVATCMMWRSSVHTNVFHCRCWYELTKMAGNGLNTTYNTLKQISVFSCSSQLGCTVLYSHYVGKTAAQSMLPE
jgi:hypothetical protein